MFCRELTLSKKIIPAFDFHNFDILFSDSGILFWWRGEYYSEGKHKTYKSK